MKQPFSLNILSITALCFLMTSGLLVSCGGGETEQTSEGSGTPVRGEIIVIHQLSDPEGLNPIVTNDAGGGAVRRHNSGSDRPGVNARRRHRRCIRMNRSSLRSNPAAGRGRRPRSSGAVQASLSPRSSRHSSTPMTRAKRPASTSSQCSLISAGEKLRPSRGCVMAKVSVASMTKSTA